MADDPSLGMASRSAPVLSNRRGLDRGVIAGTMASSTASRLECILFMQIEIHFAVRWSIYRGYLSQ
jgi:hypothetical protein